MSGLDISSSPPPPVAVSSQPSSSVAAASSSSMARITSDSGQIDNSNSISKDMGIDKLAAMYVMTPDGELHIKDGDGYNPEINLKSYQPGINTVE